MWGSWLQNPEGVWLLQPETSNVGYLDPLGRAKTSSFVALLFHGSGHGKLQVQIFKLLRRTSCAYAVVRFMCLCHPVGQCQVSALLAPLLACRPAYLQPPLRLKPSDSKPFVFYKQQAAGRVEQSIFCNKPSDHFKNAPHPEPSPFRSTHPVALQVQRVQVPST